MIIFKPGDYVYVLKNGANNSVHPRRNQNSVAEVGRVIFIQDIEYEADEPGIPEFAISPQGHVLRIGQFNDHFRIATPEEISNAGFTPKQTKTITRADLVEMVMLGMRPDTSREARYQRAQTIVNDYLNDTSSEPWWVAEVKMCHKNGLKLSGVKTLKDATGLGLKEAKDAYEFYDANGFFNINADGTIII
jgi:ribosomal protein L7/L12